MEDELGPINIDFIINNPQVVTAARQVQDELNATTQTAEQMAVIIGRSFGGAEVTNAANKAKSGFNGLENSITQITRELPAFTFSAQTGFEAISNNIGPLVDQINRVNTANRAGIATSLEDATAKGEQAKAAALQGGASEEAAQQVADLVKQQALSAAEGVKGAGVLKQLLGALFSWNTLISVGITLVTVYGKEIGAWVASLFKGKDALDQAKNNLQALNQVMASANQEAGKQIATSKLLYEAATNENNSMKDRIASAQELKKQYADQFGSAKLAAILNGEEKKSYDELTKSIIAKARASAAEGIIQKSSTNILNTDDQIRKINSARNAELKGAQFAPANSQTQGSAAALARIAIKQKQANDEINERANEAVAVQNQIKKSNEATINYLVNFAGGNAKVADTFNKNNKLLQEPLKNFNAIVAAISSKADVDNLRDGLQAKLSALAPNDKQIALYQDKLRQVEAIEKKYAPKISDNKQAESLAKQQENAAQALVRKQLELQQKLKEFTDKNTEKQLDPDQSALTQVSDQFTNIKFQIEQANAQYDKFVKKYTVGAVAAFNANPANKVKLTKTDPNILASEQNGAITNQSNLNENKYIQADIEKKKQLYAEYTTYREKLGKDAADKEYAQLLLSGKDYQSYLGRIEKSIPADDLSGAMVERRKLVTVEQQKDAIGQAGHLTELAASYKDFQNKLLVAEDNYQLNRAKLVSAGNISAVDELDISHKLEIEGLQSSQADKIAQIQHYNANVVELTRKQAKAQIQALKEAQASSDLSPEQYSNIDAQVANLKLAMGNLNGLSNTYSAELKKQKAELLAQLKPLEEGSQKWKAIVKAIAEVDEKLNHLKVDQFQQIMAKAADYADAASQGFNTIASSVADINPGLSDTLATLGEITKTIGDGAKLAGSIAEGNVAGIISGVGSVVSDVIGLFTRGKKSAEEAAAAMQKYQDDLLKGEVAYNALLRERAIAQDDITKLTITELKARQDMLKTQTGSAQSDYSKLLAKIQNEGQEVDNLKTVKYGGIFGAFQKSKVVQVTSGLSSDDYDALEKLYTEGKLTDTTKSWFEELKKVHDQMGDITDAAKAAADQLAQLATGTTASAISNAVVQGLQEGKKTVADFGDFFQETMQKAGLSFFESEVVNKKMAAFYEEFAKAAEGGLTKDKIADLKSSYNKQIAEILNQYKDLTKVIGDPALAPGSSSALTGIGKNITEDTGNQINGRLGGIQLAMVSINEQLPPIAKGVQDGLIEMRAQTLLQIKIERNTSRTADNTDKMADSLDKIKGNQGDNLSTLLRAFGK